MVFKERCDPDSNPEINESEVQCVELDLSSELEPESISISPQLLPESESTPSEETDTESATV